MIALPDIYDYAHPNDLLIKTVAWSLSLKRMGYQNPSWQSLYRGYASQLREITERSGDNAERAREFLRTLSLEQTLPFNELESPDFVDSYTSEFKNQIDILDLDADWDDNFEQYVPVQPLDNIRAVITDAYDDPEMRRMALKASAERLQPMTLDHELHLEDRGYEPDHFIKDTGPDEELRAASLVVENAAGNLRARISIEKEIEVNAFGDKFKYRIPFLRAKVQHSDEASAFISELQELIHKDHNPANIAMLFMQFQHAFCFDPKQAELIKLPGQTSVNDKEPYTLRSFINDHWEELDAYDGISLDPELSEHQLAKIADNMLQYALSAFDDFVPNQKGHMIRSRAFCEGYILSVQAGSTPANAYNAGFNAWRTWYCADANEAYHIIFSKFAWPRPTEDLYDTTEAYHDDIQAWMKDNRQAMTKATACFWTECRKRGLGTPNRPPKEIVAVAKRGTGLLLKNGRYVTWRTAVMIANAEGFDLSPERKAKLLELVRKYRWSPQFINALSS